MKVVDGRGHTSVPEAIETEGSDLMHGVQISFPCGKEICLITLISHCFDVQIKFYESEVCD